MTTIVDIAPTQAQAVRMDALRTADARVTRSDIVVAAMALGAGASVFWPWTSGFGWTNTGLAYAEGWITLAAAVVVIASFAMRVVARWSTVVGVIELIAAVALAAAPVLLYGRVVGAPDQAAINTLIEWAKTPSIAASGGLRLAFLCGMIAAVVRVSAALLASHAERGDDVESAVAIGLG